MKQMARTPQRRVDWECEQRFRAGGPFCHLHTPPLKTGVIFVSDKDRAIALLYVAIAAAAVGVPVLAYALMSNHFHFLLRGNEEQSMAFWREFERRLSLYFSRHGRPGVLSQIGNFKPTPITTLKQFRDEVAYIIRNPFVVRTDIHPTSYLWCSGFLYFNPLLRFVPTIPAGKLTVRQKREALCSNDVSLPDGLTFANGCVHPASFVDYRLVESLFENTRQFLLWTFKNVEAQVEAARRIGEAPTHSDDELIPVVFRLCRDEFGAKGTSALSEAQRIQLATRLKYDYLTSNAQASRLSGLAPAIVDAMFPLSAK